MGHQMTETVEAPSADWDWLSFNQGAEVAVGGALGAPSDDERRASYIAVSNTYGYVIVVVPKGSLPSPKSLLLCPLVSVSPHLWQKEARHTITSYSYIIIVVLEVIFTHGR